MLWFYQLSDCFEFGLRKAIKNGISGIDEKMGSESADQIAIGLLMAERLTDQICIRSEKALKRLVFAYSEEYKM